MTNILTFPVERKLIPKEKFISEIEKIYIKTESYVEAILEYCSEHEIEVETVKKYIDANLTAKIRNEAKKLHLIKKEEGIEEMDDIA